MPLPPKRARFVAEFLKDQNATQAARRAGYSKKTAKAQGSRLLTYAAVKQAIAAGNQRIDAKLDLSATRIREEIGGMAMAQRGSISDKDKLKALELLGKTEGMFIDRQRLEDPNGQPVTFTLKLDTGE